MRKVPNLRFPEFDGEWVEKRLEKLFSEFKSGQNITASQIKDKGEYPVYGGNGLRGFFNEYTHEGDYFLIGRQGALCGNINKSNGKAYFSEHAIACIANEKNDTDWLAQRLEYYNLNRLSESSAQPGLSVSKLLRFKLIVPSRIEQTKIAQFLITIDERIYTQSKIIEDYKLLKKGVMQKIFNQELRFKDEQGNLYPEWEEKKLKDVFDFIKTNSYSRSLLNYENGSMKNIHYGDIHTKYKSNFDITNEVVPYINKDVNIKNITEEQFCIEGDLVIADASEDYNDIGKAIEIINLNNQKLVAGLHTYIVREKSKMAKGFKAYLIQAYYVRKQIMKIASGISVLGISKGNLFSIKLYIPSLDEQQKIASTLFFIDKKIELETDLLEKFKAQKQYFLQNMFI